MSPARLKTEVEKINKRAEQKARRK